MGLSRSVARVRIRYWNSKTLNAIFFPCRDGSTSLRSCSSPWCFWEYVAPAAAVVVADAAAARAVVAVACAAATALVKKTRRGPLADPSPSERGHTRAGPTTLRHLSTAEPKRRRTNLARSMPRIPTSHLATAISAAPTVAVITSSVRRYCVVTAGSKQATRESCSISEHSSREASGRPGADYFQGLAHELGAFGFREVLEYGTNVLAKPAQMFRIHGPGCRTWFTGTIWGASLTLAGRGILDSGLGSLKPSERAGRLCLPLISFPSAPADNCSRAMILRRAGRFSKSVRADIVWVLQLEVAGTLRPEPGWRHEWPRARRRV